MKFKKIKLGKAEETIGINNSFWIKKFENGVKIRKKGQSEITLDIPEVFELLVSLRKFPHKKMSFMLLLSILDLVSVYQKYPQTKRFIERLLNDEVSYKEREKIRKTYELKNKIVENLENGKN